MIHCHICGSDEWIGCDPGQDAEESQGNIVVITPVPERPMRAWCREHHPLLTKENVA